VLSHLKARGWANHLSAGATNGADGFEFFKISIDLTQDGLANYQDVVASIFRYIDLLRASDFPEWAFREVQQLCELAFRFKEKAPPSSYASALSSQMQLPFPREWVLSGPYLTRDFNVELIRETAACLRPENCRIAIAAQTLPNGTKEWDARERWYGTEYALSPLPSRLLSASQPVAGQEDLALPAPNSFIPSDFAVPDADRFAADGYRATKRPVLLRSTPRGRLWHKRDDQFFMPKANVFMLLRSPLLDATPSNAVKSRLIVELVKDALTEYSYDAELAGLGYNIESQADGIGLSVDGYNDKLAVLCRYILEELAAFKVNAQRFGLIKDQVRRGYENFRLEAPYQHANYYATYLLVERMWTAEEKLRELDALTAEDVQRFLPDLLGRLHVEMLVHGNLQPAQAVELAELAESTLRHAPLSPAELLSHRSLVLPRGSSHAWQIDVSNADNVNSSIEYYCQVGDPSDIRQRATLALLAQIAQEPCFDQLRTKEQLGYLVFSSVRKSIGSMGFRILVQSERDAAYVESRIDAFLDTFKAQLEGMTDAEFAAQRDSLAHKKLEVPKNLYEESSRFWFHIHSGYYDFLQRDVDVAALRQLERKDVVAMFNEHIHQSSSTRAKLTVHMRSKVKPVRFSRAAAEELRAASAKLNVPTSDEEYAALQAQQPSVETVKEATRAALARLETSPETTQQLLTAIDELAAKHPLQEEEGDVVPADATAGVTLIEDPVAFKASLQPSRAAQPVRPWAAYEAEPQGEERGYGAAAADARQLAKI
jgi:insulysin